jgi:hypothetical protein
MVAGRADACRVRPTYLRTRAKDVMAMFELSGNPVFP